MSDDTQDVSQPQSQPAEQSGQPIAQEAPAAPPPYQPVSILQQLKEEAEEPDHKERPLAPQESAEAVEQLIQLFRQTLADLPAFAQAKNQNQQDGFVVFNQGDTTYSVYDQTEQDGTVSMLVKKMAGGEQNEDALRDFAPTAGATQLLMNAFPPEAGTEAVIAFESPGIHWTMRDTAGEEFPWPVQNTTLAVAQAAGLAHELASHPAPTS